MKAKIVAAGSYSLFHLVIRLSKGRQHTWIIAKTEEQAQAKGLIHGFVLSASRVSPKSKYFQRTVTDSLFLYKFCQMLGTYIKAGLGLDAALILMIETEHKPAGRFAMLDILNRVRLGQTLAQAMAGLPKMPAYAIAMLRVADTGVPLSQVLEHLADGFQQASSFQKRWKSAMTYPIVLTVVGVAVCIFMMSVVVPQYAQLFASSSAELPKTTRTLLDIGQWFGDLPLLAWVALPLAFYFISHMAKAIQSYLPWWRSYWYMPYQCYNVCALARLMSQAKIPVQQLLAVCESACTTEEMSTALAQCRNDVMAGLSLSDAFTRCGVWPTSWQSYMKLAEHTGDTASAWQHIYSEQHRVVHQRMDTIVKLSEPALISVFGVLIGLLLVILYQPLFSLGTAL